MAMIKMEQLDLRHKRVLIRQDLNTPISDGCITNDRRIVASVPTIRAALDAGAAVMLMSHLGRPTEGKPESEFSLQPVAERLSELLGQTVTLVSDWLDGVEIEPGQVKLCENVRFCVGEKADDEALAKRMAALCDIYVMDAFGTAHRAQASTHGVARFAPLACAGPLLAGELEALGKALDNPRRPLVAIVGGSKVSSKLTVLNALLSRVDRLVLGGGIANTFIAASGHSVGKSLYEADLVDTAKALIEAGRQANVQIPLPTDVAVAKEFSADSEAVIKAVDNIDADDMVLDIGPDTAAELAKLMSDAGTIVWNGPLGVFEFAAFADGTRIVGEAIANSAAFSVAGGGDTLAALDQFSIGDRISYVSTGGGAFLEFLEGKTLPAVAMLEQRAGECS